MADINTILETGAVGVAVAAGGVLMQKLGINAKILAAIQGLKGDTVIAGHPKETEALDALEQAGLNVLQDLVKAHPDCLATLEDKLAHDSLTNVGAWLVATYGPELMADLLKQGEDLVGIELKLVFGGQKAVEDAAVNRLGMAAQKALPSLKTLITAPSGRIVIGVAPKES